MSALKYCQAISYGRYMPKCMAASVLQHYSRRRFSSASGDSPKLSLLGVPSDHGQPNTGVAAGPAAIRCAGISQRLSALGWDVHDVGDVSFPEKSLDVVGGTGRPQEFCLTPTL